MSFSKLMMILFLTVLVAEKQKKSGFSGLKRIGTVMRRNKEPKQTEKAPPTPDKRTRSSLNPLRRGSSARNMQMIPSPNTSMTELADTSARHTPPSRDQNLSRTTSTDHPRVPEEANGHVDGQAASSQQLPNGSQADQEAAEERKPRPPSTIVEEVRR